MTERRMIPGFRSLRKGKPDLTARPTPIPRQYISRRRDMLAEVHKRGKLVRGKEKDHSSRDGHVLAVPVEPVNIQLVRS